MKTILCYGDSITWGYNPSDGIRYPFNQRWPGILQFEMGDSVRIIEEALSGRTTNWDSPFLSNRNGRAMLGAVLESHSPIDIFILMLGTNDLWVSFDLSALEIASGCLSLIWDLQKSGCGPEFGIPQILLIAPPPLGKLSSFMDIFFHGRLKVSKQLGNTYKKAADAVGCLFLDASKFVKASRVDGVHLDPPEHRKLALKVRDILMPILK